MSKAIQFASNFLKEMGQIYQTRYRPERKDSAVVEPYIMLCVADEVRVLPNAAMFFSTERTKMRLVELLGSILNEESNFVDWATCFFEAREEAEQFLMAVIYERTQTIIIRQEIREGQLIGEQIREVQSNTVH